MSKSAVSIPLIIVEMFPWNFDKLYLLRFVHKFELIISFFIPNSSDDTTTLHRNYFVFLFTLYKRNWSNIVTSTGMNDKSNSFWIHTWTCKIPVIIYRWFWYLEWISRSLFAENSFVAQIDIFYYNFRLLNSLFVEECATFPSSLLLHDWLILIQINVALTFLSFPQVSHLFNSKNRRLNFSQFNQHIYVVQFSFASLGLK